MHLTPLRGSQLLDDSQIQEYIYLLPYLFLLLFRMLTRRCTITWESILFFIYGNLHWLHRNRFSTDLCGEYINEFLDQCLELGLKLWGSFEGDLRQQLFRGVSSEVSNGLSFQSMLLLNEFIVREHPMWEGVPTLRSVGTPRHRA